MSVNSFAGLIALAAEKRDVQAKLALQNDVRLVRCEDGQLEIALEERAPKTLVHDLQRKISGWTGKRWIVVVSKEEGAPTMRAQADERAGRARAQRRERSVGAGRDAAVSPAPRSQA